MTTLKAIDSAIASFETNRDKLRDQAHEIAMMIFRHAAPKAVHEDCTGSGDCTRALKLVQAMPNSWQVQMTAWFKAFTPIKVLVGAGKVEFLASYKAMTPEAKISEWKLEQAAQTPFHLVENETAPQDLYDFEKIVGMIPALAKRIEKAVKDGKVKEEDKDGALHIATVLSGLRIAKVTVSEEIKTEKAENDGEVNTPEAIARKAA